MTDEDRSSDFQRALLALDRIRAGEILRTAAAKGGLLSETESVVVPALERIGDDWSAGAISLAQLYMAGRIAEEVVTASLPATYEDPSHPPRIAIVVLEDHHALGKRLVLASLRAAGHLVADWGHGLAVDDVLARCRRDEPRILLISTLMLPSALAVRRVVQGLASAARRPTVIVGGAPFRLDPALWQEVGAEAAGADSADAVRLVARFLGGTA